MSKTNSLEDIRRRFEEFVKLDLSILYAKGESTQEYPNHSPEDIKQLVEDTSRIINKLLDSWKIMEMTSFHWINVFNSNLNGFINQFTTVKSLKSEQLTNQHHSSLNQLATINQNFRQSGIYSILTPSIDIPQLEENLNELNQKASEIVTEATDKAKIIRDLIPEAAATSLSVSMDNRAISIEKRVDFWRKSVIVVLILSFFLSAAFLIFSDQNDTSNIVQSNLKAQISKVDNSKKAIQKDSNVNTTKSKITPSVTQVKSANTSNPDTNSFTYWLKRAIVFLPIFYLIIFCIKQYNRERKLLEIYIHKKSIGQTLPAYIAQAISEDTKDEILLRGATMIFTLPENPETPVQGSDGVGTSELKDLLDIKKNLTN